MSMLCQQEVAFDETHSRFEPVSPLRSAARICRDRFSRADRWADSERQAGLPEANLVAFRQPSGRNAPVLKIRAVLAVKILERRFALRDKNARVMPRDAGDVTWIVASGARPMTLTPSISTMCRFS